MSALGRLSVCFDTYSVPLRQPATVFCVFQKAPKDSRIGAATFVLSDEDGNQTFRAFFFFPRADGKVTPITKQLWKWFLKEETSSRARWLTHPRLTLAFFSFRCLSCLPVLGSLSWRKVLFLASRLNFLLTTQNGRQNSYTVQQDFAALQLGCL